MPSRRLFESLVLFQDREPRGAGENMAADEALFPFMNRPWLRVYGWREPSVSIGCFTPWSEGEALAAGRPLVRRWTGGGLVEHGEDWTWTIGVPEGDPFLDRSLKECYRRLHGALLEVWRKGGFGGLLQEGGEGPGRGAALSAQACFAHPVAHDVMDAGLRKLAGGAIRRTRSGLLYQGSAHWPGGAAPEGAGLLLAEEMADQIMVEDSLPHEVLAAIPVLVTEKYGHTAWCGRV